jgi:hypothetical protein
MSLESAFTLLVILATLLGILASLITILNFCGIRSISKVRRSRNTKETTSAVNGAFRLLHRPICFSLRRQKTRFLLSGSIVILLSLYFIFFTTEAPPLFFIETSNENKTETYMDIVRTAIRREKIQLIEDRQAATFIIALSLDDPEVTQVNIRGHDLFNAKTRLAIRIYGSHDGTEYLRDSASGNGNAPTAKLATLESYEHAANKLVGSFHQHLKERGVRP